MLAEILGLLNLEIRSEKVKHILPKANKPSSLALHRASLFKQLAFLRLPIMSLSKKAHSHDSQLLDCSMC